MILLLPIATFLFILSYAIAKLNLAKHQKKLVKVNGKIYEDKTPKSKSYSLPVYSMMCYLNNKHKEEIEEITIPKTSTLTQEQIKKIKAIKFDQEISKEVIVEKRSKDIEDEYLLLKQKFSAALKNRKIDRDTILGIRKYLSCNVSKYEKKAFKNDAHAIYTMLKAKDLKLEHLKIIEKVI